MELKKKRGIFFSLDVLVALGIILTILLITTVYFIKETTPPIREAGDVLIIFSTLKVGEINNSFVQELIDNENITNTNNTVLEQIGEFWVTGNPLASELAESVFNDLNISANIGLWYESDLIASRNNTAYEESKNIEVRREIISGIQKGNSTTGFVAKAWLKKINAKTTSINVKGELMCGRWRTYNWGEYCGAGPTTIYYKFEIPENSTIIDAFWLAEPSWTGQPTTLTINGNEVYSQDIPYFVNIDIENYVVGGNNTAILESQTGGDDGASHIVVQYETAELSTFTSDKKFYLYEMEARATLNQEKSLFIPEEISKINVTINTSDTTTAIIRTNSEEITIGSKSPSSNRVSFTSSEIESALSSNGLSLSNLSNSYFTFIFRIGTSGTSEIGSESFIEIEKESETEVPFGAIDITQPINIVQTNNNHQSTFYHNILWEFHLPENSIPIKADFQLGWLSTGNSETEQKAVANNLTLYNSPPDPYIEAFSRLGYSPTTSEGLFLSGQNNLNLSFGDSYSASEDSSYGDVSYFIRGFVNYGSTKEKAQGGQRLITFEDNSSFTLSIGNTSDVWDPEIDAIDESVERLLSQLDANNNSKIDLIIDQNSFDIDTINVAGVPYLWSSEVQLRTWY